MKKGLLTLLITAASLTAQAADYDYFTIVEQDGTKTSLTAVGLTITFSDGNLVAENSTTAESKTVALSSLASLNFSTTDETTTTGISSISTDSFGLDDADAVYDLSGRQLPQGSTLTKGIYIIKKGSVTRKIQVR